MIDKAENYDVFISYRRKTGVNDARLLQQALKARGYNVFFDFDSLRDGKFDERISLAIEKAPVFILMLTENSLDMCVNEGDWVRAEIGLAVKAKRKVIPVQPSDQVFSFPAALPDSVASIVTEQISELNKGALFEESVDRIIHDRFPSELQVLHVHGSVRDPAGSEIGAGTESPIAAGSQVGGRNGRRGIAITMIGIAVAMICMCFAVVYVGHKLPQAVVGGARGSGDGRTPGIDDVDLRYVAFEILQSFYKCERIHTTSRDQVVVLVERIKNDSIWDLDMDVFTSYIVEGLVSWGRVAVMSYDGRCVSDTLAHDAVATHVLSGKVVHRAVRMDNGAVQNEYHFMLQLVEKSSGLLVWQKKYVVCKQS